MAGTPRKRAARNSGESLEIRRDAFVRLVTSGGTEQNICKVLMLSKAEYVQWMSELRGRIEELGGKPEFPPVFYELRARLLQTIAYADDDSTLKAAGMVIELMKRAAKLGPSQTKNIIDLAADEYFGDMQERLRSELGVVDILKLKQRARDERLAMNRAHSQEGLVQSGKDEVVEGVMKDLMEIEI